MMWMGKVSGIAALAVGALFVALAAASFAWSIGLLAVLLTGVLLLIGGFRTLRRMSGGLRLLSGAWGMAAGLMLYVLSQPGSLQSLFADFGGSAYVMIALACVTLAGLALTVLHKEK